MVVTPFEIVVYTSLLGAITGSTSKRGTQLWYIISWPMPCKRKTIAFPLRGRWILRSKRRMRWNSLLFYFITNTLCSTPHQSPSVTAFPSQERQTLCPTDISLIKGIPQGEAILWVICVLLQKIRLIYRRVHFRYEVGIVPSNYRYI